MKQIMVLGFLVVSYSIHITAMNQDKPIDKLTFTVVQKGENLDDCELIVLKSFVPKGSDIIDKMRISTTIQAQFAVLNSWIGRKNKLVIKVHADKEAIGFMTLEPLDEKESHIAINLSSCIERHFKSYIACLRVHFPKARTAYTYGNSNEEFIRSLGFVDAPEFVPNKELVPDPKQWKGFSLDVQHFQSGVNTGRRGTLLKKIFQKSEGGEV